VAEVALDTALLNAIADAWANLNAQWFRGALSPPAFCWEVQAQRLGSWHPSSRTIAISRALAWARPWLEVMETLQHEMAHQYVSEILNIHDETPHGPAFRKVCERMGLSSAATEVLDPEQQRALQQVQHLLALAESPHKHEAEQAMKAAQRRMLKHNLKDLEQPRPYRAQQLGPASGRIEPHRKLLAGILAQYFFVRAIWVPAYIPEAGIWGRALEISGTSTNLELASYAHDFLLHTCEALWKAHRKAQGLPTQAERRRYLAGALTGFAETLREHSQQCAKEGLLWKGNPALEEFVRQRHPRLRKFNATLRQTSAWEDGKRAGRKIVLHKAVSSTQSHGRLLDHASDKK